MQIALIRDGGRGRIQVACAAIGQDEEAIAAIRTNEYRLITPYEPISIPLQCYKKVARPADSDQQRAFDQWHRSSNSTAAESADKEYGWT